MIITREAAFGVCAGRFMCAHTCWTRVSTRRAPFVWWYALPRRVLHKVQCANLSSVCILHGICGVQHVESVYVDGNCAPQHTKKLANPETCVSCNECLVSAHSAQCDRCFRMACTGVRACDANVGTTQ